MRVYNFYRKKIDNKIKPSLEINALSIEKGDIIIQHLPCDENGLPKMSWEIAVKFHENLKRVLPEDVKVLTTPLKISTIKFDNKY